MYHNKLSRAKSRRDTLEIKGAEGETGENRETLRQKDSWLTRPLEISYIMGTEGVILSGKKDRVLR